MRLLSFPLFSVFLSSPDLLRRFSQRACRHPAAHQSRQYLRSGAFPDPSEEGQPTAGTVLAFAVASSVVSQKVFTSLFSSTTRFTLRENCLQAFFAQVVQFEIEPRSIGINLPAGNPRTKFLENNSRENVQRGVMPHVLVAQLPIDDSMNLTTQHLCFHIGRDGLGQDMYDSPCDLWKILQLSNLVFSKHQIPLVRGLPASARIQGRPVENNGFVIREFQHGSVKFLQIVIVKIQHFCHYEKENPNLL